MKKENVLGAIAGGVLGVIIWLFQKGPYDTFGIGPFIFVLVCAWGGIYTFGPHIK
jgi:hypothetical protein